MNLIFGWFNLVGDKILETGIEINIDGIEKKNYYKDPSTFRFEDNTASKDADLDSLIISSGIVDSENEENSTYKEYELIPKFDMKELNYELTLLEYIDTMDITVAPNDTKSTMKIKVPKKDEENNLIYEEKDIAPNTPFEFTLNELGEPDTIVTVIVTAENGNTNEYELVIKRPFGTIVGKIYTEPTKKTTGTNNAQVFVYDVNDTIEIIDWDVAIQATSMLKTDNVNSKLHTIKEKVKQDTKDDGSFEILVIPGNYDILIDKPGYLDRIFVNLKIEKDQIINLVELNKEQPDMYEENLETLNDLITLFAGDSNKNGVVEILDSTLLELKVDKVSTDNDFNKNCDFNNNDSIEILDSTALEANTDKTRKILRYSY